MPATKTPPKGKKATTKGVPKWVWIAVAVAAVIAYVLWRRASSSSTSEGNPSGYANYPSGSAYGTGGYLSPDDLTALTTAITTALGTTTTTTTDTTGADAAYPQPDMVVSTTPDTTTTTDTTGADAAYPQPDMVVSTTPDTTTSSTPLTFIPAGPPGSYATGTPYSPPATPTTPLTFIPAGPPGSYV
jgi:hypothetical protein